MPWLRMSLQQPMKSETPQHLMHQSQPTCKRQQSSILMKTGEVFSNCGPLSCDLLSLAPEAAQIQQLHLWPLGMAQARPPRPM